jgi:hypothetical protein
MNQQVKTKWLDALRSGNYHQTQGRLRDTEGFCCLGVLCDLYTKEKGLNWDEYPVENGYRLYDESCTLPEQVMNWSGLEETNPTLIEADLARLNDDGFGFSDIADLIEEQL